MAEVKRKRGRPRKNPLPEEITNLIEEVQEKAAQPVQIEQPKQEPKEYVWDFPKDSEIKYFDTDCSYEITGYRPISKTQSLDFDPDWFTEARQTFLRTGYYTQFRMGSPAYREFWDQEYQRCINGMEVNGYRITGDNYFFLNYFQLLDLDIKDKAGSGRNYIFPAFYAGQYELFHYIELCRVLRLNSCIMKSREIGWSEILSAIAANSYNSVPNSVNIIAAFNSDHLSTTLSKVWNCLSFLNDNTQGGFFKLSQVINKQDHKKASAYKLVDGQKVEIGFGSQVIGIVANKPNKIRGYRADMLIFEEAGSFKGLSKEYIKSTALVGPPGASWGIRLVGGTSGDTKEALEGLKDMFYDPLAYGILPHRHSYSQTGEQILTSYFVPCTKIPKNRTRFLSHRGYVDYDEVKDWQLEQRSNMINNPKALMDYCAEFPLTDAEAFSAGNINKFNKVLITEQLTKIRALKIGPTIEKGFLGYTYKDGKHIESNINGFKWTPDKSSKLQILEHPIWTLPPRQDDKGKIVWAPPEDKVDNLYVVGVDGIDIGASQTSEATKDPSDFCCVVYKRVFGTDCPKIVALYKDRPNDVREAYKTALILAQYYNAVINIEATRMSFFSWAKTIKQTKWFMKRPRATLSEQYRNTNKQYGTPATAAIIAHQTDLIAEFVTDYYDEIWFDEVLDELNNYTDANKRKFDIVASLGMCMLADEELMGKIPKQVQTEDKNDWKDIGYYYDSNGVKHYGIIPQSTKTEINISWNYDDLGIRSTDPRAYKGYI